MKKSLSLKKLALNKETLRSLEDGDLNPVIGGVVSSVCLTNCRTTCYFPCPSQ
jgi:hypothetical protein